MNISRIAATFAVSATLLLAGCMNEDLKIDNPLNTNGAKGYLSLSQLSVECVTDHQPVNGGVSDDGEAFMSRMSATTRAEVDINDFDCYILDATGSQTIMTFKYGERPSESIELDKGNYLFRIMSGEIPGVEWESPIYGVTEPFTILRDTTTQLTDLVCTLQNIQVSVSYSADLLAALSEDTTTTITVGENSMVFPLTESRSAYFLAPEPTNDIAVLVKGSYTPEGKDTPSQFEMNATIKDVKPGQYSDITLIIEYSDKGSIGIDVSIDGWVADEEIVCDFSTSLTEEIIDENENKPVITWVDNDIDTPVTLGADKFDDRGNCLVNFYIDIEAENTISALKVDITSTSTAFISSLSSFNIPTSIDMCNAGDATSTLRLMGYAVNENVTGQTNVSYDLTPQMKQLREFGGTHDFKITAVDAKGGTTEKTLSITIPSEQSGGPSIVWTGYDIDQRYTVTDGMTVDIVANVPAGIKSFVVTIISDTLTPSELRGVGLCDQLDLVNPENSKDSENPDNTNTSGIQTALDGFGFPTGDKVLNQTNVGFSITGFLPLLSITGAGDHNFVMTIVDNDGVTIEKTLMLRTE